MTRKMAWIGAFYLIGLLTASFIAPLLSFTAAVILLLFGITALAVYRSEHAKAAVCLISAAAGLILYSLYDCLVYDNITACDGRDVKMTGRVTAVADHSGDKSSYTVKGLINGSTKATVTCYTDSSDARIGDIVSFTGKAAVPSDTYTFSARSYYKAKGIFLRINGASGFSVEPVGFSLKRTINDYRDYLLDVIYDNMDADCAAIMSAMLFGDKSGIDSDEKTLMYRAGIGHVMAVSGVHLSVVCSLFWFVLSRLPINKYVRFALLLVPAACFVLMAGASNSVLRAAVMTFLVYGAGLFRRRPDTFNSLGISVIVLTIASPYAVRDASFLLSVAGVFGIGVIAPAAICEIEKRHKPGKMVKSLIASFCAMIAVFPVSIMFFDEVSVISPISNVLLLPICEIVLLGGIIVTLTGGIQIIAVPVLKICEVFCRIVIIVSEFLGRLSFAYIPLGGSFVRAAAAAAVIAAVLAFVFCGKKGRALTISLGAFALAIVLTNIYRYVPDGNISVTLLKDQSAVTAVIHDKRSACVVDLDNGGKASSYVRKYLNENGLYRIDAIVLNADANLSLPVYLENFGLFETDSLLVPEEDAALVGGYQGDICFYGRDGGSVDMDDYTLHFFGNGDVALSCRGVEMILSGGDLSGGGAYSVVVWYGDKDGDMLAAGSNGDFCYGENIRITIDRDGNVVFKAF